MPFQPSQWHFEIDEYLDPWVPAAPWKHLPHPVARFLGHRPEPQRPLGNISMIFWAFIGVFCSITIIEAVSRAIPSFQEHGSPIIIGSLGAAAVLEFYSIDSPLAQPRNAVLGQVLSSIVGIAISKLFALGPVSREVTWIGGSLACACATAVMALTGTVHPPAGATALLAVVDEGVVHLGWFLLPIIVLGCILMQCVALLLNNIQRRFPIYWWTPAEVGRRKHQPQNQQNNSDSECDTGAKLRRTNTRHLEEGRVVVEEAKLIIKRGRVLVPDDVYLTPEDKMFLEELSKRL
ncbi:HPP family-domain-containing protein [Hypoxylon sp. FL0890]|nr:HPP family-domain-containing protein [Hypoxylon sp. FL0890]